MGENDAEEEEKRCMGKGEMKVEDYIIVHFIILQNNIIIAPYGLFHWSWIHSTLYYADHVDTFLLKSKRFPDSWSLKKYYWKLLTQPDELRFSVKNIIYWNTESICFEVGDTMCVCL